MRQVFLLLDGIVAPSLIICQEDLLRNAINEDNEFRYSVGREEPPKINVHDQVRVKVNSWACDEQVDLLAITI